MECQDDSDAGEHKRQDEAEEYGANAIVEIGHKVPDFKLYDVDGCEHQLSQYHGSKILLCFYRYSFCPIAAMSFGKLMGGYKKLAWASKLKVSSHASS